ncbi:sensor histidine kinase [Streptomyces halobius]|uniref:histidine kinase n=1 Tax=Streptomyces halobius TaxID=2879846 RepID=A0ABY4M1Z9_9ACTN|nr:ATP-binding protein [Streptomyces halobius]UQA91767.1 ATP-binding protein [Streptomyces halobius]
MPTAFPLGTQSSQEAQKSPGAQGSPGTAPIPSATREREQEGGRHGRASFPESAADAAIRSRLVRLTAVPCLLVAVTCAAVAAFVVQSGGAQLGSREWAVLAGGLTLICVIVLTAGAAANSEARATGDRYARLRQVCARSESDLYDLLDRVRQGDWTPHREPDPELVPTGDTLDLLAHEVAAAGRAAESVVIDAVAIARGDATGSEQKVEVFVNLARRLQSLVHREIELLDELENQVEDPDLLKGLFHIDHLATRIRRHAENLAVLGGAVSRRQWSRPVSMTEVLRSAIAEVEQYPRVKLVPPIEGTLRGHAVADVIHLLAELVENASIYSAPQTHVLLRAQLVTAGLAVEVEDRGLGMSVEEQSRMNELLADPEHIDVAELLSDGRIGLFVVSSLARRHGIVVRLQSNIYGGVQAVLVLPQGLLGEDCGQAAGARTGSPDSDPARDHQDGYDDWQDLCHELRHEPDDPSPHAPAGTGSDHALEAQQQGHDNRAVTAHTDRVPGSGTTNGPAVHARGAMTASDDHPADPGPVVLPPPPPAPLDNSARPRLPRRRKQQHLVPELRGDPILPSATRGTAPEPEPDPGLMAAFRRGFSLADESYAAGAHSRNTAGGHGSTAGRGGDRSSADGNDPLYDRDHDTPTPRPRGDDLHHGE